MEEIQDAISLLQLEPKGKAVTVGYLANLLQTVLDNMYRREDMQHKATDGYEWTGYVDY